MPGRTFNNGSCRYGFNGKENDNEIKGNGNQQDYGARIYDPRLGRFFSVDPLFKKYPELTPYQFASNRPIDGVDLDGLEHVQYTYAKMPNGQPPKQIGVTRFSQVGPKGQGIAIRVIDASGHVIPSFIKTDEPPPAPKTILEKTGDAMVGAGKTLCSTANLMKVSGIVVAGVGVATLQPELVLIGAAGFEAGVQLDNVAAATTAAGAAAQGDYKKAALEVGAAAFGEAKGFGIHKMVGTKIEKMVANAAADKVIEQVKDKGSEMIDEAKETKEAKSSDYQRAPDPTDD
ncbi:MAG: RHS repeat-associated core domain-containing protein [Bacteroidia bacterium]